MIKKTIDIRGGQQESVRLLSELLDQAAELLGIPEKDWGKPDTFLETIEALKDTHFHLVAENQRLHLYGQGFIDAWRSGHNIAEAVTEFEAATANEWG